MKSMEFEPNLETNDENLLKNLAGKKISKFSIFSLYIKHYFAGNILFIKSILWFIQMSLFWIK